MSSLIYFSALFSYYAHHQADVIVCPSSFTTYTGQAHWHTLLKARAIETQSYILAPNQYGRGGGNVMTYGHSMIIDPWGDILQEGPESGVVVLSDVLSKKRIQGVRSQLPMQNEQLLYNYWIGSDN
mgnify:CR=1 FL=1